jgi:hypothetical protein
LPETNSNSAAHRACLRPNTDTAVGRQFVGVGLDKNCRLSIFPRFQPKHPFWSRTVPSQPGGPASSPKRQEPFDLKWLKLRRPQLSGLCA